MNFTIESVNGDLVITVTDNGVGIKKEIAHKIWEMFFVGSLVKKGNGLGLYIARKAASALDGEIALVDSEDGLTTFKVVLPIQDPAFYETETEEELVSVNQ